MSNMCKLIHGELLSAVVETKVPTMMEVADQAGGGKMTTRSDLATSGLGI